MQTEWRIYGLVSFAWLASRDCLALPKPKQERAKKPKLEKTPLRITAGGNHDALSTLRVRRTDWSTLLSLLRPESGKSIGAIGRAAAVQCKHQFVQDARSTSEAGTLGLGKWCGSFRGYTPAARLHNRFQDDS